MRIDDLLAQGPTTSFEFFPPVSDEEELALDRALEELAPLRASFVSVTYRGGAASRSRTYKLVRRLHEEGQRRVDGAPHLRAPHPRRARRHPR